MLSKISYVAQEDTFGCGIAVLAMLTGVSYAQVSSEFANHNYQAGGITEFAMRSYLAHHGYACALRLLNYLPAEEHRPQDLVPFGDVHFACVDNGHYVVVFRDGMVLDPARPGERHIDMYTIRHIAAVVKI